MLKLSKLGLFRGRRIFLLPFLFLALPVVSFFILNFLFPLPLKKLCKQESTVICYNDGSIARVFLTDDEKIRIGIDYADIPVIVKDAFISAEDRYFYYHPGINPFSIVKALYSNIIHGEIVSGASTITMQAARMMEPKRRTLFNKIIEAFRSLQIELKYSKNDILTIYLNLLPFGGNIEGIETASLLYFSKSTRDLNPGEIAILTTIPRSPAIHNPSTGDPEKIRKARDRALKLMLNNRVISSDIFDISSKTPLPENAENIPFSMPHYSDYLYYRSGMRGKIISTIDKELQAVLEKSIKDYMSNLKKIGIKNISAVIVSSRTNEVLAAVGSEDYFEESSGQIIGFDSPLSPGSLLKPFLYAECIESGLITPSTLLEDVPIYYSDYEPTNYGGIFTGVSSAKDALCNSLNIPAIKLLEATGTEKFFNLLKSIGFSIPYTHDKYGLSIILGSAEITMLEALRAFSAFNNKGTLKDLVFTTGQKQKDPERVFKEGTSYIISEMLSGHPGSHLDRYIPYKVAWKTGTSYMYRDAWALGYNPDFIIGVWTGNLKGAIPPVNTGHSTAAPLMFMLFNLLMKNKPITWYRQPEEVTEIDVCSLSGMIPNDYCPHTKKTLALASKIPMEKCRYHQLLPVDSEGYAVCNPSSLSGKYSYSVFVDFPPSVSSWLRLNKNISFSMPKYRKDCSPQTIPPPLIIFPQDDQVFELSDNEDVISLKISASDQTEYLYLFIDDTYIERYPNDMQINIRPEKGTKRIYIIDDSGQPGNTVTITVK